MVEEKLLNIKETSLFLGISEREVIELAESGKLPAYKVGGIYLRFKREQLENFKKSFQPPVYRTVPAQKKSFPQEKVKFKDRFEDFFYFNDFYILSMLIILLILVIIFSGY